jgi:uncharacterized protein (DUF302 family)
MPLSTSKSPHSVRATADRIIAELDSRGIELFARVDHGGGAHAAGLELADEELLIFGDPRAGTPLMHTDARVGYELPLRLLVWSSHGETVVGFRPPAELAGDYDLADHAAVLERMGGLLEQLVAEGVAPA